MRVLGLCSYPREAAATRFRLEQFVEPLADMGIKLTVRPFLDSAQFEAFYQNGNFLKKAFGLMRSVMRRGRDAFGLRKYDLILVQREAMMFGPPVFEWLYQVISRAPMVLDLDDATYVKYVSPTYGPIGSYFKFFGKTDDLIARARVIICGNRYIAEYVASKGGRSVVIPTVVDTEIFCPKEKTNDVPVVGWIGTPSTFPFLESIFPVLERLAKKHRFILKVVGAKCAAIKIDGVEIEVLEWGIDREVDDFQSLDIGLYPITVSDSANVDWILGKSGFKAIQYMAVGVPFVVSPVGVCAEMGEPAVTHYEARSPDDWYDALDRLLSDEDLRLKMGLAARRHSLDQYCLKDHFETLAKVLNTTLQESKSQR